MKHKPKRLSLSEMWELYKLLGGWKKKEYLLDEIVEMMQTIPPENIKLSLKMMYKDMSLVPLEVGLMFVKGLKHNKFFEFQIFMDSLS